PYLRGLACRRPAARPDGLMSLLVPRQEPARSVVEYCESPKTVAVVLATMLLEQIHEGPHRLGPNPDLLEPTAVADAIAEEPGQVLPEPRPKRHPKTTLGPRQYF